MNFYGMIPFTLLLLFFLKKKKQWQVTFFSSSVFTMLEHWEGNKDIVIPLYMDIFIKIHKKLITECLEYRNERKIYFSLCILCISICFEAVS